MSRSRKWFQKHKQRDLPGYFTKISVRMLLLVAVCAMLSIVCFQFLMQYETWFYFQMVKWNMMFSFKPEKILEEIQEKAKDISFYEDRKSVV